MKAPWQALIVVSFGGPEGPADVIPFLENVLRGRNVPRERMLEVAEHYRHFGGVSPIGAANRQIAAALQAEFDRHGPALKVYQGNRNWRPFLADTLRLMAADGVTHALALVTSAFGSYSGCRQYREDLTRARAEVGAQAPELRKLRLFFNHPQFIAIEAERVRAALERIPAARRETARLLFTAHSVPLTMANCGPYEAQLREAAGLIAAALERRDWDLAWQSRSGPPQQPWLEPDVATVLREYRAAGATDAVMAPLGFLSDHMEVVYDLDTEAQAVGREIGFNLARAGTPGDHPAFAGLVRELALEAMEPGRERRAAGGLGPWPDECPEACCVMDARAPAHARRGGAA